jgi:putative ABC transport system permease protein
MHPSDRFAAKMARATCPRPELVMFLALREMRRAMVRFALLMASIGLLVFLILFQQTLQNGLITSFVGAIEQQSAPVLVYSVDGRRNLQGSIITPALEEQIRGVDGVGAAGLIGQGAFSVTAAGELTSAAIIGYSDPALGAPDSMVSGRLPESTGEVVAIDSAASDGFDVGDTVTVEPGGLDLEVVGLAERIGYQASTTLFTTYATYEAAVGAANPDAGGVLPAVMALTPADGITAEELVGRVNDAVPEADALTRADAAAETPGVAQVRQSFQVIFLLYGLVIPLITGLFFLIITLQKANSLTLLRAVGVPGAALVRSLLFQVFVVMVAGIGIGIALYTPLANQRLGGIPLSFQTGAVVFWAVTLLALGVLSSLFSARRVLRIDPLEATTGAGVST